MAAEKARGEGEEGSFSLTVEEKKALCGLDRYALLILRHPCEGKLMDV